LEEAPVQAAVTTSTAACTGVNRFIRTRSSLHGHVVIQGISVGDRTRALFRACHFAGFRLLPSGPTNAMPACMTDGNIKVLALTVCLVVATTSHAEGPLDPLQTRQIDQARALKKIGIAFTSVGATALVAGLVLEGLFVSAFSDSFNNKQHYPDYYAQFLPAGVGSVAAGCVLLGAGIPLWAVGNKREGRARAGTVSITPNGIVRF
jgi:hypothetical protein